MACQKSLLQIWLSLQGERERERKRQRQIEGKSERERKAKSKTGKKNVHVLLESKVILKCDVKSHVALEASHTFTERKAI